MPKQNKYEYIHVLQGYYAHGWEDLCASVQTLSGIRELRQNKKEYQENEGGRYRIISRRELISC